MTQKPFFGYDSKLFLYLYILQCCLANPSFIYLLVSQKMKNDFWNEASLEKYLRTKINK
jgi:hypothetical protein